MYEPGVCPGFYGGGEDLNTAMVTLYVSDQSLYLAGQWLYAHAGNQPVQLLAARSCRESAQALQRKFAVASEPLMLPEPEEPPEALGADVRARVQAFGTTRVVLPVSFDSLPLRYSPETNMPDVAPRYPIFRQLWTLGFREFDLFNLWGTSRVCIPYLLDEFRNRHKGQRCFVVGNGPSLNQIDMTRLRNEITLGANRCYLGYEKWGFPFTYWGINDGLQIERHRAEYETHIPADTVKFFPIEYLPLLRFENACPVNVQPCASYEPLFSDSCERVYMGSAVTYLLVQVAAVMGCDPIVLVGVDHRYALKTRSDGNGPLVPKRLLRSLRRIEDRFERTLIGDILRARRERSAKARRITHNAADFWNAGDAAEPTHFDARYLEGENREFATPSMKCATDQFACAARWGEQRGVRILNATPGTALKTVPLIPFDDLF